VTLSYGHSTDILDRLASTLAGCYSVYHTRLVEDWRYPLARELLYIYYWHGELLFCLWDQNQRSTSNKFLGKVIVVGHTIWLVGQSSPDKRLRVMAFRDFEAHDTRHYIARWGILLSDIPKPDNLDPAACRVLIWKCPENIRDIETAAAYVKDHVKEFAIEEFGKEPLKSVWRLVSINTSAESLPHSILPAAVYEGWSDAVLKVDQVSIQTFCETAELEWEHWQREERIKSRAQGIWEREGRPEGKDKEHWQEAQRQIAFEDKVRDRAHDIWENEDRPEGKADEHWRRAEAEILAEEQRSQSETRTPRRRSIDGTQGADPSPESDDPVEVGLEQGRDELLENEPRAVP
jgi:hypothetical protein